MRAKGGGHDELSVALDFLGSPKNSRSLQRYKAVAKDILDSLEWTERIHSDAQGWCYVPGASCGCSNCHLRRKSPNNLLAALEAGA
jgi:hypothetical protein